ncbi:MAG: exodeoxyribonuclease VII large subunit [Oscillospiraceae bacterium]|jgi:exodeoxyribonuclease VII large subunit|nr:exodeoxyribonuclease VII large subunit [Oscillospiraceae bacterium]
MEIIVLTVSQLNSYAKSILDEDKHLKNVFVSGEVSGFTDHYQSGHYYFSLKDENSIIRAVMFKDAVKRLKFKPENGMKLLIRGKVSLYSATGQYQLYAQDMQPEGIGALNLAFQQLKEKLEQEGLFDIAKKRPIPVYPERIGIITSPIGAALHDILNILNRRFPLAEIVFCPVHVQGERAPLEIAKAIESFKELSNFDLHENQDGENGRKSSKKSVDVIILGRGGGSFEDLYAFNEEIVARAVFSSNIPIVSGVGHETDYTICDFVADLRAPTPSAAAEIVAPDKIEILFQIRSYLLRLQEAISLFLDQCKQKIDFLLTSECMQSYSYNLQQKAINLDLISEKLRLIFLRRIEEYKEKFATFSGKLEILNPLKILKMGYAIVKRESKVLRSVLDIKIRDVLNIDLIDGNVKCLVLSKEISENEKDDV